MEVEETMIVVVSKNNKNVLGWDTACEEREGGFIYLPNKMVMYTKHIVDIFEVEAVPKDIEIVFYKYTEEGGFEPDADSYEEAIHPDVLQKIKDNAIQEVQNELNTETTGTGGPA